MNSLKSLNDEILPPFDGFPKEGLRFLRALKKNNRREWFLNHKSEYENLLKLPMQSLLSTLKADIERLSPEITIDPKKDIFRIHRDTRFSKNKLPYKTHIAAVLHPTGHWTNGAGYYVHVEPGSVYVGGGTYMPDAAQLKRIREAIVQRSQEFEAIVCAPAFIRSFRKLEGTSLTRPPLGFPKDHPAIRWLKQKSFYVGVELPEGACLREGFSKKLIGIYTRIAPLISFLNTALGIKPAVTS